MTYIRLVTRIRFEGILVEYRLGAGKLAVSHIPGFINSYKIPLTTIAQYLDETWSICLVLSEAFSPL